MKRFHVYKIINPKGGTYVGCTTNLDRRKRQYMHMGSGVKGQRLLFSSLREYGYENHIIETICDVVCDDDQIQSLEMFWIRTLMSNVNRWPEMNGMNLTNGGWGTYGRPGALKGKRRPTSVRRNMSKGCTNKKPVIQMGLDGSIIKEHESMKAAADYINAGRTSILRAANSMGKSSFKGYLFKYK